MTKQQEILSIIKMELNQHSIYPINDIILYGSQANGKANEYSDYDILIISKQKLSWQKRRLISDICADISIDKDVLIDCKIISSEEISQNTIGNHPLIKDAVKFGIHA